MSHPSTSRDSSHLRSSSVDKTQASSLQYQDLPLAGSTAHSLSLSPHPAPPYQDFSPSESTSNYIQPEYPRGNNSPKPSLQPTGQVQDSQDFYSSAATYYERLNPSHTMMMSQKDINYGYMPGPMHNPLHSYSQGQSYASTLAPLPGYYADSQAHRNLSGSSRPSNLPILDIQSFEPEERDPSLQSRKRRRTSQTHGIRRQAKLQVRRNRLPGITDLSPIEHQVMGGSVDLYPIAPAPAAYVQAPVDRSNSRPSMSSSSYRNDFNDGSSGVPSSQYVSQSYQTGYTMGPINSSNLAPPLLPNSNSQYGNGRSSPMLQAPLPPAPTMSPHIEPVVLDRREKPQCWDHGCNGREFSTFSNLLRHQREKSGSAAKSYCPHCGAEFTRTTARNGHMEHGKCKTRRASDTSQR